ncbi:hypothetical protein BDY21DRAFT_357277 [Lineolata rhizophorae]|uniref:Uncharacterized protein n=1 Tax=Lineolata rhizophorae TaxID=578093 RepID=A0A6A6NN13_9PEZI|nr:hypothetical protein BDY21DRAFT_357277 [Lineolata rhizophorae]
MHQRTSAITSPLLASRESIRVPREKPKIWVPWAKIPHTTRLVHESPRLIHSLPLLWVLDRPRQKEAHSIPIYQARAKIPHVSRLVHESPRWTRSAPRPWISGATTRMLRHKADPRLSESSPPPPPPNAPKRTTLSREGERPVRRAKGADARRLGTDRLRNARSCQARRESRRSARVANLGTRSSHV